MAFAVPSNLLQQTIQQIVEAGKVSRPWLGIRAETLGDSPALKERLAGAVVGVVVLAVEADGPAFKTDLRPADVIQSLDGKPVGSALELQRHLFHLKAGQAVRVVVWRQGVSKSLLINLAELPAIPQTVVETEHRTKIAPSTHEQFGLVLKETKGRGVRVDTVVDGSIAFHADLQPQDIITEVENRPVRSPLDCLNAIRGALGKSGTGGALLQLERGGRRTFVLLKNN